MIYHISYPGDQYERVDFSAGETQIRLKKETADNCKLAQEVVVTANIKDGDLTRLGLLTSAIGGMVKYSQKMTLILPYFPYSRADRKFTKADGFGLGTAACIITLFRYDRVLTVDMHSNVIETDYCMLGFKNLSPLSMISAALNAEQYRMGSRDISILLPDAGAHRYDLSRLKVPVYQCQKTRIAETGVLSGFIVPEVHTKHALIVDDICDGGGTFVGIADTLKFQQPEVTLGLYVTHGIFSKGLENLNKRFGRVYCTDTFNTPDGVGVIPYSMCLPKELQNGAPCLQS